MSEKPNPEVRIQGSWKLLARIVPLAVTTLAQNLPDDDPRKKYAQEAVSDMPMSPDELLGEQSVDSQKEGEEL